MMTHEEFLTIEIKKLESARERTRNEDTIKRIDELITKLRGWMNETI